MLPLIETLFKALEKRGVDYCHWKSNAFLALAVEGEDDLDLLARHAHRQAFLEILDGLGFKEACEAERMLRIPGILDYYGLDETSGRLVHVHFHDKLVVGHDMTKNYHLPVENACLASAEAGEFCRVPAPEFELILLVIRMTLKHSTWNAILGGEGGLSKRELEELRFLQAAASREEVERMLTSHFPFLARGLFDDALRSLTERTPFLARVQSGRRIQRALRGCRRRSAFQDIWLQYWRRLVLGVRRRLLGSIPRKRLRNGGMLLAFVGGDGAGKSTLIKDVSAWLSPPFALGGIHMGKPSWSPLTVTIRGVLKAGRILRLYPFARAPVDVQNEDGPAPFPGYPSLIREVCTARDRYLSYKKARRKADRGFLVLCDRFPLPSLMRVDGPLVERLTMSIPANGFIRLLGRLERSYYRSIAPPDLLVVLKADPDIAVKRKKDEDAAYVRARSRAFWEKNWDMRDVAVIDAGRPLLEVANDAKLILWARL